MSLKQTQAPGLEPVDLEEAKNHLKVDGGDDNTLIQGLITTARQLAEKETNRAFITQKCGRIKLKVGYTWPIHRGFASFIIGFTSGYGDAATDIPAALRQEILQLVGYLYSNRGEVEIPDGIKATFSSYKIKRI